MSTFLVVLIVSLVLGALFAAAGRAQPLQTSDGGFLLEYAKPIKGYFLGATLLGLFSVPLLLIYIPIKNDRELYAVITIAAFFGLFAIYSYIEFFTVKISVGPKGVGGTSGWKGRREYTWDEISRIDYSPVSMWFKISAAGKPSLRIHAMITGVDKFQTFYMQHMPEEKWLAAHEKVELDQRFKK